MPIVLRIGGYAIGFFSADRNERPHVHVSRAGKLAKFWLDPVELAKNRGFSKVELNGARKIVWQHQIALAEQWHEYFKNA
jgi:hypothetical protein